MSDVVKKFPASFNCCEKKTEGDVVIRTFSRSTRNIRALKAFGGMVGLSLLLVFIPVAHFVLVPLSLLALPIVVFLSIRQSQIIEMGEGRCPMCGAVILVNKVGLSPSLTETCPECRRPVDIVIKLQDSEIPTELIQE